MEWKHEAPHMVIIKFLPYNSHRYKNTHTHTHTLKIYVSAIMLPSIP